MNRSSMTERDSKRWSALTALKAILNSFRRPEPAASAESFQNVQGERSALADGTGDGVMSDLISAGTELSQAAEELFELISEPDFTDANFLLEAIELRSAYDEYLELLEAQMNSKKEEDGTNNGATSNWTREDLAQLYVAFDYDRSLLATAIDFVQAEVSVELSDEPGIVLPASDQDAPINGRHIEKSAGADKNGEP